MPLFGLSAAHVRAGALAAFAADPDETAAKTAELVRQVLAGKRPGELRLVRPERVRMTLNRRTAAELGISLPQAILAGAEVLE